jgi:hypothetical protein
VWFSRRGVTALRVFESLGLFAHIGTQRLSIFRERETRWIT